MKLPFVGVGVEVYVGGVVSVVVISCSSDWRVLVILLVSICIGGGFVIDIVGGVVSMGLFLQFATIGAVIFIVDTASAPFGSFLFTPHG